MLVRLIYASRAIDAAPATVEAILQSAREHNHQQGVTGVLVYGGGVFMQAIEGGRQTISDLYGTIQRDARHKDVLLLHYEEIGERRFGGWTMGLVNLSRINTRILLKYAERAEFDPHAMSGKVALALLDELMATASVASHT